LASLGDIGLPPATTPSSSDIRVEIKLQGKRSSRLYSTELISRNPYEIGRRGQARAESPRPTIGADADAGAARESPSGPGGLFLFATTTAAGGLSRPPCHRSFG
jgi:hypothetical protein